jgi:hypothetical protein
MLTCLTLPIRSPVTEVDCIDSTKGRQFFPKGYGGPGEKVPKFFDYGIFAHACIWRVKHVDSETGIQVPVSENGIRFLWKERRCESATRRAERPGGRVPATTQ